MFLIICLNLLYNLPFILSLCFPYHLFALLISFCNLSSLLLSLVFYTFCLVTRYTSLSVCTNHLHCTQASVPRGIRGPGKLSSHTLPLCPSPSFQALVPEIQVPFSALHLPQNFSNPHLISLPCLGLMSVWSDVKQLPGTRNQTGNLGAHSCQRQPTPVVHSCTSAFKPTPVSLALEAKCFPFLGFDTEMGFLLVFPTCHYKP